MRRGAGASTVRLDIHEQRLVLTLSRRNLLALLHKLDWPGSAREITGGDAYFDGTPIDFRFAVRCEDDAEHYAKRPEPPGPMHPESEQFIRDNAESSSSADESAGGTGSAGVTGFRSGS